MFVCLFFAYLGTTHIASRTKEDTEVTPGETSEHGYYAPSLKQIQCLVGVSKYCIQPVAYECYRAKVCVTKPQCIQLVVSESMNSTEQRCTLRGRGRGGAGGEGEGQRGLSFLVLTIIVPWRQFLGERAVGSDPGHQLFRVSGGGRGKREGGWERAGGGQRFVVLTIIVPYRLSSTSCSKWGRTLPPAIPGAGWGSGEQGGKDGGGRCLRFVVLTIIVPCGLLSASCWGAAMAIPVVGWGRGRGRRGSKGEGGEGRGLRFVVLTITVPCRLLSARCWARERQRAVLATRMWGWPGRKVEEGREGARWVCVWLSSPSSLPVSCRPVAGWGSLLARPRAAAVLDVGRGSFSGQDLCLRGGPELWRSGLESGAAQQVRDVTVADS